VGRRGVVLGEKERELQAFTLRMPADEYEALRTYVFATGAKSINDVIVRAVREYLTGPGRREEVDALFKATQRKFRVALDKLADL
jgi:hypothetical protein